MAHSTHDREWFCSTEFPPVLLARLELSSTGLLVWAFSRLWLYFQDGFPASPLESSVLRSLGFPFSPTWLYRMTRGHTPFSQEPRTHSLGPSPSKHRIQYGTVGIQTLLQSPEHVYHFSYLSQPLSFFYLPFLL